MQNYQRVRTICMLVVLMFLTTINCGAALPRPSLTVNMNEQTGDIIHGAAGFLYGISSEGVPSTNTLIPLKPKVLSTQGALGTEHPYGDARHVAKTFFEGGGEQIMMYNSNYYAIFGPTASVEQYSEDLKNVIAPAVVDWKKQWKKEFGVDPETGIDRLGINIDEAVIYVPINEGTPATFASGASNFNEAWKSYYNAIKSVDPDARIAGPNDWDFFGYNYYRDFLRYSLDNDCLPDVITWHELDREDLAMIETHVKEYERACETLGISPIPVVINEYATAQDTGVPGRVVNWIARLEEQKLYGCLPFWHMANNLNDLAAEVNQGNSAWWVYKWYGDMSGQTLKVNTANTAYDGLYGLASMDENKNKAYLIFGGIDGPATIILDQIHQTVAFSQVSEVFVRIETVYYNGFHGPVSSPILVKEGTFPVIDGKVVLEMNNMSASGAYNVTVVPAGSDRQITEPIVGPYYKTYEAEYAQLSASARAEFVDAFYFISGGRVRMNFGGSLTYNIQVPTDGKYKLEFVYGNGQGTNTGNEVAHNPRNLMQTLTINQDESFDIVMENTLLHDMTGVYVTYADLRKGSNTIKIYSSSFDTIVHDLLNVSYAGAYEQELPLFNKIYEAEEADFNALGLAEKTEIKTGSKLESYSYSGYVTGLNRVPVEEGGGIRWSVIVDESGLYNLKFRYQTDVTGYMRVYLDNTARTFDNKLLDVEIAPTNGKWEETLTTVYLQKGINIIDVDATVDVALDYMQVIQLEATPEIAALSKTIMAEEGIVPEATEIRVRTTTTPPGTSYVVGLPGDAQANTDPNKYLEYQVRVPNDGLYKMQVFQSNKDIFGTHAYNPKAIDKYFSIQVNDNLPQRYFFRNTFSNDTFKEQTIPIMLEAGTNSIKIFNDDSWYVYKGIANFTKDGNRNWYQDKPGDIRIENYTPNLEKFIFTPAVIETAIRQEKQYLIKIKHTGGGVATANRYQVEAGDKVEIKLEAYTNVIDVMVNGESVLNELIQTDSHSYTFGINDIQENQDILIEFSELHLNSEYQDQYITNASFGTGDLTGWVGKGEIGVEDRLEDRYEGYYLELGDGASLQQSLVIPAGIYYLNVVSKGRLGTEGEAILYLEVEGKELTSQLNLGTEYEESNVRLELDQETEIKLGVRVPFLTGKLLVDSFNIETISPIDSSKVDYSLEYFVDCGDHNPTTLSSGDRFGVRNSRTDQIYGLDRVTGYMWGVVDEPSGVAGNTEGAYTMWTWPHERETGDNLPKTTSFRYARNQIENGISPRFITYKFELEPGIYDVEICLGSFWNNSRNPQVYANKDLDTEILLGSNLNIDHNTNRVVIGQVVVGDGMDYLTIDVRSNDATINLNYIKIAKHLE